MPRDGALILSDVRNPTLSIVRRSEGAADRQCAVAGRDRRQDGRATQAYVELVGPRPGEGAVQGFSFGRSRFRRRWRPCRSRR